MRSSTFRPLSLLVLGGTRFLGRAVVEAALADGHQVTLFNRGRTNPGLFPGVETVTGDRTGDLSALSHRRWDAVVDVAGSTIAFGAFFEACRAVAGARAETVWVPSERLLAAGVDPWMGVPLWIADPACAAINRVDVSRALAAGLTLRPLAQTLADTLAWDTARGGLPQDREGLSEQEEHRLLRC